jgi:hypothetical protein
VFYLSDTGNNRVLAIEADDLAPGDLFASVGSVNTTVPECSPPAMMWRLPSTSTRAIDETRTVFRILRVTLIF